MKHSNMKLRGTTQHKLLAVFVLLCMLTALVPFVAYADEATGDEAQAAATEVETVEAAKTYTVRWINWDNSLIKEETQVVDGELPKYEGETPTRPKQLGLEYKFVGWAPVYSASANVLICKAVFVPHYEGYSVTWLNYDGTELEVDTGLPYNSNPHYNGEEPTREADAQYTYKFSGWEPELSKVTEDQIYVATYEGTLRTYTITWVDEDGTELEKDTEVPYGETPTYDGAEPTKDSTAQYTYKFDGWDPEVDTVTGDATYTATYKQTTRTYTVTWLDEDGTQLELDEKVEYGKTPTYDGAEPTKPSTKETEYTFAGWDPEVSSVTGDATYTAKYEESARQYTLTYDLAGGELDGKTGTFTEAHPYGANIKLAAAPTRDGYTFQYWKGSQYEAGADYTVTEDHTFTAVWEKNSSNNNGGNKNNGNKNNGNNKNVAKRILPRTGDDFNAAIPFAFSFMGAALLVGGYALRRRNLRTNR